MRDRFSPCAPARAEAMERAQVSTSRAKGREHAGEMGDSGCGNRSRRAIAAAWTQTAPAGTLSADREVAGIGASTGGEDEPARDPVPARGAGGGDRAGAVDLRAARPAEARAVRRPSPAARGRLP